jgi:APA family basic amino acid/polyamine antiporter
MGWHLILEYTMGAATIAIGWSEFITSLLFNASIAIAPALAAAQSSMIRLPNGSTVTGIVNLPAAFIVSILTTMLVLGTKETARLNNIMVAIKLLIVTAFIVLGTRYVNPDGGSFRRRPGCGW